MEDEMEDDLLFPGDVPGVLRRGSPVEDAKGLLGSGVVRWVEPSGVSVCWDDTGSVEPVSFARAALDLTDATGRAHLAWALAREARHWPTEPDYTTAAWRYLRHNEAWSIGPHHYWPRTHHTVADLNPDDPHLLPDGSRWVDAVALGRVARHVLGVSQWQVTSPTASPPPRRPEPVGGPRCRWPPLPGGHAARSAEPPTRPNHGISL